MAMKMFYKILHGYDDERNTPIEEDELEKAYGLFLLGGRAIFRGGAVDSKHIQAIVPDWHRIMGWAQEFKLGPADYNELSDKGIDLRARELQKGTQERVQYLVTTKQASLIGTGAKIPELERPTVERREGTTKSVKELLSKNLIP